MTMTVTPSVCVNVEKNYTENFLDIKNIDQMAVIVIL